MSKLRKPPEGRALAALTAGLNDLSAAAPNVPQFVRDRLQAALDSPSFYLDCAELILHQVMFEPEARFLVADPASRYTMQIFCWPAGFGNQPHLHDNWSVSAILSEALEIRRSSVSEADCLTAEPLLAEPGRAGVLVPPQYHCLRNGGKETAISFHIFGIAGARDNGAQFERRPTLAARLDDSGLLAIAREGAKRGGARAKAILRSAFAAAGNATKLDVVKLMVKLDAAEAVRLGRRLARLVGGEDGRRLLQVVERLDVVGRRSPL